MILSEAAAFNIQNIIWAGVTLVLLGTGFAIVLLIAAVGVVRLPDALSRQHAATKAGTAAVIAFAIGTALIAQDLGWTLRLVGVVVLLLFTLPLASHTLGRAAAHAEERASRGRDG